jgi:hypothetical protein
VAAQRSFPRLAEQEAIAEVAAVLPPGAEYPMTDRRAAYPSQAAYLAVTAVRVAVAGLPQSAARVAQVVQFGQSRSQKSSARLHQITL